MQIELRRRTVVAQMQDQTLFPIERIAVDLIAVAHRNPKDLSDTEGKMLPVTEMPERIRRAISSIEVDETFELVEGSNSNQTEPKRNKKKSVNGAQRVVDRKEILSGFRELSPF